MAFDQAPPDPSRPAHFHFEVSKIMPNGSGRVVKIAVAWEDPHTPEKLDAIEAVVGRDEIPECAILGPLIPAFHMPAYLASKWKIFDGGTSGQVH